MGHWGHARLYALLLLFTVLAAYIAHAQDVALESQCARFDLAQNASLQLQWQLMASGYGGPYTRISHSAVALTSPARVLIIGGIEYESAQPVVVNTTIVYNPQTDLFALPVDLIASSATAINKDDVFISPASRVDHASALAGPSIALLFGGQNAVFLDDLWRLCMSSDSNQAKWDQFVVPSTDAVSKAATPIARIGHSISVVFGNVSFIGAIVFGGLSESNEDVGTQLSLALVAQSSVQGSCGDRSPRVYWRTLNVVGASQPDSRAYHAAAPVSKIFSGQRAVCLVVYGGKSLRTNLIYGDVWRLCPVAGSSLAIESQSYQWELITPIGSRGPGPRYGAAIVFVDEGKVAIAGGSYAFPNDFLSDLWEFNINATQWLSLRFDADFTPPRRGHAITLLGDRLFLFGGRDRYSVVSQRMHATTYAAPYCITGRKITLCEATGSYACVPCPSGYFLEAGTRRCLPCGAGTYSAEGAAACTMCPVGTFNTLSAQTQISACLPCPKGSFSNTEGAAVASTCLPCNAGTFAASTGASNCASCAAGTFSSANASSCSACSVGQWSDSAAAQCSACVAGLYNPRNGSPVCFPCPKGFYSDNGAEKCTACPVNTVAMSIATADASGCSTCPALMTTGGELGRSSCQYCSPGYSVGVDGTTCQPCQKGSYSGGAVTAGACVLCPVNSYAAATRSTRCEVCSPGTFTTSPGSVSPSDCRTCSSTSQFFDGQSCRSCSPGSSIATGVVPRCEICSPGTYSSSMEMASLSSGCQQCPTMAVAAAAGQMSCIACADDSFAMAAWRSCISCASTFLAECPKGRNGLSCSGNGACVLRSCECASGWSGGDCSLPISSTTTSDAAAVLFFPADQSRAIQTRSPTASTFSIRVVRAGSGVGELRAQIRVKSTNSSVLPASAFPALVTVASGASGANLTFPTASFAASSIGSSCRLLELELVDVSGDSAVSTVSLDPSDRSISLFFDDMNGVGGSSSGGGRANTVTTQYNLAASGIDSNNASLVLDHVVPTKHKLQPPASASLSDLPLNFRVAVDPSGGETKGIVDLFPALVSRIQMVYSSSRSAVRMGMLNPDSNTSNSTIYQSLPQFFGSSKRVAALSAPSALDWQWLVDRVKATNSTQWRFEDSQQRRFILVFLGAQAPSGDITLLATTLRQNAIVAFIVSPPGSTLGATVPSDVMVLIPLVTVSEMPQKITTALKARDASATVVSTASILVDSANLFQSGSPNAVSFAGPGLPTLELTLAPIPTGIGSATLQVSVPGFVLLTISVTEPGASCSSVPGKDSLLLMDDNPLGGWIGAWHLVSDAKWGQLWQNQTPVAVMRYNDSSLLRLTRTSVVAITSRADSRRVTLQRTFDGAIVAPGLDLVTKAYVRHTSPSSDGISCAVVLQLVPADANYSTIWNRQLISTRIGWTYLHFSTEVPFEISSMQLRLDCNTTQTIDTVEWTHLGLFPDPQIACLCPQGFFYDSGVCVRCPAGSYCVAGIKRECTLGFFSFGKADHCERCREGWICVDGLVRLCQAGTYAAPDSTCTICPAGFACRNGMKSICPAGSFSLAQGSDCQLCPPGAISLSPGSSLCQLCPFGSTSNFQRDHCVPCHAGETTSHPVQHPCASCVATAFMSSPVGEVCVATR